MISTESAAASSLHPNNPVVASAAKPSPHPYSSLALSPDRRHACCASKDSLHVFEVGPSGITAVKVVPIAQHFQTTSAAPSSSAHKQRVSGRASHQESQQQQHSGILDAFLGSSSKQAAAAMPMNVVVTSVAWSSAQDGNDDKDKEQQSAEKNSAVSSSSSFIAAAGSNGVIVVFTAESLLNADASPLIEVVLSEHVRAVNGLDWHSTIPGLLLSASQDGTVLLWEREVQKDDAKATRQYANPTFSKFFGGNKVAPKETFIWKRRAKFEPKSEAVRDIQWNPFYDDVFALVTTSGSLIAYNRHVTVRALVKLTAHSGDATSLDWHPLRKHVIATGGANDRSVKVWNLEEFLNIMDRSDDAAHMAINAYSMTSRAESTNSNDDSNSEHVMDREHRSPAGTVSTMTTGSMTAQQWHLKSHSPSSTYNTLSMTSSSRQKGPAKALLHVLAVSASVTRLRWRPPATLLEHAGDDDVSPMDHHSSMIAVATAPVKGASAGGGGILALWTCDRPFVPLRVVQGHKEGAVTGFEWLETPQELSLRCATSRHESTSALRSSRSPDRTVPAATLRSRQGRFSSMGSPAHSNSGGRFYGSSPNETDILLDNGDKVDEITTSRIWQHVLSVGRDGQCYIQSFLRGDDPLSRVPPSCFAMANLSPFQKGYGSLQIFSVSQALPTDLENVLLLTGLRRDSTTTTAPGIFCEPISDSVPSSEVAPVQTKKTFPSAPPDLVFNVLDQGDLDDESKPVEEQKQIITVAPEVVHLSRFADRYVLYPNEKLRTRSELCLHNGAVAESLKCGNLAHMWRMVASMLDGFGCDGAPEILSPDSSEMMQFVIFPTLKSLLEERAEEGDVQTCVALCELLGVIQSDSLMRIPGLPISLVREWYLSYIDLLKDMCLFSHASYLIRSCNDPFIGALNQQSTTIHEACQNCSKPLQPSDVSAAGEDSNVRRTCRSCRKRVGLCFLCHEPVKGMYVWCPGCGHGGHLDHALQWFGGLQGKAVRESCPTGCGHKCNLLQQISAFPRTTSMKELSAAGMDPFNELAIGYI